MTHNLDATVFVYRNHKDKKIKAEYFEKARLLEDSPDWEHIATLEPRIWIEFNYDTIEKTEQEPVAWMEECADFWEHYTYINEAAQEKYNEDAKMWIEKLRTTQPQPEQEPVAIEYWMQDTMESGRWVTTDNMEKVTAEKMLSGEYGNVYPQGRIVDPSQPKRTWVGLTDDERMELAVSTGAMSADWLPFMEAVEAKLKEKNT